MKMDIRKYINLKSSKSKLSSNAVADTESTSRDNIFDDENDEGLSSQTFVDYESIVLPDKPYQPADINEYPRQVLEKRTLKFQKSWYSQYKWIHFEPKLGGILCYECAVARKMQLISINKRQDGAFILRGFSNWRKALEKMKSHENSDTHKLALNNRIIHLNKQTIDTRISSQLKGDQIEARKMLLKIVTSLRFIAERGLAARGHNADDGNLISLLNLRSEDDPALESWLKRSKLKYTSGEIQNEIFEIMSNEIKSEIVDSIKKNEYYGIVIDGTQDNRGIEQESICIRSTDEKLDIHEYFVGIRSVKATTGKALSEMLFAFLDEISLGVEKLRSQTFDGASNMSGVHNGCQALIKEKQPLALFFHCGAHITHLVTCKSIGQSKFMRDAAEQVQELGTLYNQSGKFKALYSSQTLGDDTSVTSLKPICPTRWLTRSPAIKAVKENYGAVLTALASASENFGSTTATRANGLHRYFMSGTCALGLIVSIPILENLENLNKILQGRDTTVAGMVEVVNLCISNLKSLRSAEKFSELYKSAEDLIVHEGLHDVVQPRPRKAPKRLDEGSSGHVFETAETKLRLEYFMAIDTATGMLESYFDTPDMKQYKIISGFLLGEPYDEEVCALYPELKPSLKDEVTFFRSQYADKYRSIDQCRIVFKSLVPEVKALFPQVETLLRLVLVSPASSCEAERSFSVLRRIKTWLRSSMTQKRLENVMLCHVHRDILMKLCPERVVDIFIRGSFSQGNNNVRKSVFGSF